MGEGFASQQVKDLKKNSRKKERKKFFDRTRKLDITERKKISVKKEVELSHKEALEIKAKISKQRRKEKIKNYFILIISIIITFTIFNLLYSIFRDAL
ncbi:hypothetical protein [Polaribacter sp. Asnod6-C07]|uniref:hypothetical protein n=1 Tax=Polaribacter sp. Asnod6-C07 TaxID=3160582 RepID=UPI003867197E